MPEHRTRIPIALVIISMVAACQNAPLRPADIVKLPSVPPAAHLPYGPDLNQFADLRLPDGRGPFPVVAVIHGGCGEIPRMNRDSVP